VPEVQVGKNSDWAADRRQLGKKRRHGGHKKGGMTGAPPPFCRSMGIWSTCGLPPLSRRQLAAAFGRGRAAAEAQLKSTRANPLLKAVASDTPSKMPAAWRQTVNLIFDDTASSALLVRWHAGPGPNPTLFHSGHPGSRASKPLRESRTAAPAPLRGQRSGRPRR
jgi:hypothetical protein